jgi:TPR repeat protein
MSLENVTADASLERNEYHKLDIQELEKLDDAEALYQRGDRILSGISIKKNLNLGQDIMIEAARRGHAVALGVCFLAGRGVKKNRARAVELFRASADRGHASGSRMNSHSIFQTSNLTIFHSSIHAG